MDLKNGQITIGEIMKNQEAARILKQEIPMLKGGMAAMFSGTSVNQVLAMAKGYGIPAEKINNIVEKIKNV